MPYHCHEPFCINREEGEVKFWPMIKGSSGEGLGEGRPSSALWFIICSWSIPLGNCLPLTSVLQTRIKEKCRSTGCKTGLWCTGAATERQPRGTGLGGRDKALQPARVQNHCGRAQVPNSQEMINSVILFFCSSL